MELIEPKEDPEIRKEHFKLITFLVKTLPWINLIVLKY